MKSGWVAALVVGLALVPACSDSASPPRIDHVTGADEVLIQVGDYSIGGVPDEFVVGPELIVYGDGSVYVWSSDGTRSGRLTESQMQRLLRDGEALPVDAPVGTPTADALPLLVVSGTHFWEIGDLGLQPLRGYVGEIRSMAGAAATVPWTPSRWIGRPFEGECSIVADKPSLPTYFVAPVYPHLVDQYPLGECPAGPVP